jgi:hypothetical protein
MFKPWGWRYIKRIGGKKEIRLKRNEKWKIVPDESEVVLIDYEPSGADPEDRNFVVRPDSREKWFGSFEFRWDFPDK